MAIVGKNAIEAAIYSCISDYLLTKINGGVYLPKCRPQNSRKEDAIIVCSTATASQIQEGRAKVNIFVADLTIKGQKMPNIGRLRELEAIDCKIIDLLNKELPDYIFWFSSMTDTIEEPATREHFININLQFKHNTF